MLQRRVVPVEVGLLRLFYALIQRVDESSLAECWPLQLSLLKEGLQLNLTPPAVFLLLKYEHMSLMSGALYRMSCCYRRLIVSLYG